MVTLAHASLLLLAPLGFLAVWAASRTTAQSIGPVRRAASLAVRCLIVLILTLALGGPVLTRVADYSRCTVFLLDASASLPQGAAGRALRDLKPRWDREVAAGHRCALVAFAGRPQVLVAPSTRPLEIDSFDPPPGLDANATDVTRAFETARTLFQEHAANRIVVLSDGLDSTRPARSIEIPPDTVGVSLADPERLDVAITDVQAPLAVRSGEPFDVRVTLATNRAGEIQISAVLDNPLVPEATTTFRAPGPGRHVVVLRHLQQKAAYADGVHGLFLRAQAAGDREPRNNIGRAAITVTGKPRVLLVEGTPPDGEFVARVLKAQDIDFVRRSPRELVPRAEAFDEFVAVVLAGVARDLLPAGVVTALRSYVEHAGGGLWVVGSAALQGPQGYAGGDFEKLLPVAFSDAVSPVAAKPPKSDQPPTPPPPQPPEPEEGKPQKVLAPQVALLLMVDKSGSMAGRNIELVKEACIATAKALSPRDVVAVLAFDVRPNLILEFTEAERSEYIEQRILRLLADGGTQIFPALVQGFRLFQLDPRAQRCAVKHAVLLSDGDAPPADYESIVRKMAEEGITVSTICVSGAKFDPGLMSQIASWGNGHFTFTNSFSKVPQFMVQDVQRVLSTVPKPEKPLPPGPAPKNPQPPPVAEVKQPPDPKPEDPAPLQPLVFKDPHEILAGVDGRTLPGLRGRLAAVARPKADVPVATREGHPVLALGRLGLGKTAVWTSDLSGAWSAEVVKWKDAPKLVAQLIRYVSGSGPDADLAARVRVTRDGSQVELRIDPTGAGGAITVTDLGDSLPLPAVRDAQGEERVSVAMERPGEKRLLLQRADGKKLQLGLLRAYEEEFAPADPQRDLFANGLAPVTWDRLDARLSDARVSGEQRRDLTPWLIIAALLLLPLDVALRRVVAR